MKMTQPVIAFAVLLAVHTLVSAAAYRLLTTKTSTPLPLNSTPLDTTTPEQRAQRESSFQIVTGMEQVAVTTPWSVRLYVVFGYAGLVVALLMAIVSALRPSTP
jgi:hypothetical protein